MLDHRLHLDLGRQRVNTTRTPTMDLAIQIKLTEKQYHLLKEMARKEYRTIGNTATMLLAEGFNW